MFGTKIYNLNYYKKIIENKIIKELINVNLMNNQSQNE